MKKKTIIVITLFTQLISYGCSKNTPSVDNPTKNVGSEVITIANGDLDAMNYYDFLLTYGKLPDDYPIEVSDLNFFKISYYDEDRAINTKSITKAEALERLTIAIGIDLNRLADVKNLSEIPNTEEIKPFSKDEERRKLSLKGLRYFSNLQVLWIENCHVSDFDELELLGHFLNTIYFNNCTFEGSLYDLCQSIDRTAAAGIHFTNCNLTDVDFLKEFKRKEGMTLDLSNNRINDLNGLRSLKQDSIWFLYLDNNEITDVTPLTYLNLQVYSLKNNRITDFSPLKELEDEICE